ncbi:MAG TPA: hypothetical protein VGK48_12355 [Terriglobia bacterium]
MTTNNHLSLTLAGFVCGLLCFTATPGAAQDSPNCYDAHAGAAYEAGLRDGRSDAAKDQLANLQRDRFTNTWGRHDYEDGYIYGFQNPRGSEYKGETSVSSTDPWRIQVGPDRNILWHAPENADIWVQVDDQPPTLVASGKEGTVSAPWMSSGHRYIFILRDPGGIEFARDEENLC